MKQKLFVSLLCAFFFVGCASESYEDNSGNGNGDNSNITGQGATQKPGTSSTGNTSVPSKTSRAYSVGDSCDESSYGMFCDGTRFVKCQEGKVLMKDCADYNGVCETFADFPDIVDCVYSDDPTCSTPGQVVRECTVNEYHEEVLVSTTCTMSSNGSAYEFVNAIACAEECSSSKGCYAVTCSGEYSSCSSDGKWLTYCHEGKQYTVNCTRMKDIDDPNKDATCVVDKDGIADCTVDWDKY